MFRLTPSRGNRTGEVRPRSRVARSQTPVRQPLNTPATRARLIATAHASTPRFPPTSCERTGSVKSHHLLALASLLAATAGAAPPAPRLSTVPVAATAAAVGANPPPNPPSTAA